MENRMMNKNEVLQRIDAVCKNLDGGITVSDVRSAGNQIGRASCRERVFADV